MNWYRFKVELSAWGYKTIALVLTALVLLKSAKPKGSATQMWSAELSFFAYHEWVLPTVALSFVVVLWMCYWRAFHILRSDSRYGTR